MCVNTRRLKNNPNKSKIGSSSLNFFEAHVQKDVHFASKENPTSKKLGVFKESKPVIYISSCICF